MRANQNYFMGVAVAVAHPALIELVHSP